MEEKSHGGARRGAGRKSVLEEQTKNAIIQKAVNMCYDSDSDEEGKQALIIDLLSFERGKMFIAEHLLGKPKEVHENINIDAGKLTPEEVKVINQTLDKSY